MNISTSSEGYHILISIDDKNWIPAIIEYEWISSHNPICDLTILQEWHTQDQSSEIKYCFNTSLKDLILSKQKFTIQGNDDISRQMKKPYFKNPPINWKGKREVEKDY